MGGNITDAVGTMGSFSCTPRHNTPSMSITKSLDEFVKSVQKMKDVIMIPHQLKDIKYLPDDATNAAGTHTGGTNGLVGSNALASVDTPPSSSSSSVALITLPQEVPLVNDPNLFVCYKVIDAVYNDLVNGPVSSGPSSYGPSARTHSPISTLPPQSQTPSPASSNMDLVQPPSPSSSAVSFGEDDDGDESRLVLLVRQHVGNFLAAIHQLTDIANVLTNKYQEQVEKPVDGRNNSGDLI